MLTKTNLPYALILISGILWGFIGVFVRILASYGLTSIQIVASRFLTVAVVLAAYIFYKDRSKFKLHKPDIKFFILFGVGCLLAYNVFFALTIQLTSMSVAVALLYTSPIWAMLLSIPVFGEKLTPTKGIAILLSVLGCALVSGIFAADSNINGLTILTGALSGLGYGSFGVISKKLLQRYHSLTVTFYPFLFASIGGFIICDPVEMVRIMYFSPIVIFYTFVGAFMCFVIPFVLYTYSLNFIEASKAAVIVSIEPVCAAIIGLFVYSEEITLLIALGMLSILSAIFILNRNK